MSIGTGGYAELMVRDETALIYQYTCYNLNTANWKKHKESLDGELLIQRAALIEPILRVKQMRSPSGRKRRVVRRIRQEIPLEELLASGKVTVQNASGTWMTTEAGIDIAALRLIERVFYLYQDNGTVPEQVFFYC